jgi:hypothetical protein
VCVAAIVGVDPNLEVRPFYDELASVAGTLLVRPQRSFLIADTLKTFQNRCAAAGGSVPVSNPMGLRQNGRR